MSFHPVEYVKTQLLIRPIKISSRLAAGLVLLLVLLCAVLVQSAVSRFGRSEPAVCATPHPTLQQALDLLREEPKRPRAHEMLGFALYDKRHFAEAELEFRKALLLAQPHPLSGEDARRADIPLMELCLARCLLAQRQAPDARSVLEGVMDLDPPGEGSGPATPGREARDLLAGMN
jgi:hypothetical protein